MFLGSFAASTETMALQHHQTPQIFGIKDQSRSKRRYSNLSQIFGANIGYSPDQLGNQRLKNQDNDYLASVTRNVRLFDRLQMTTQLHLRRAQMTNLLNS